MIVTFLGTVGRLDDGDSRAIPDVLLAPRGPVRNGLRASSDVTILSYSG